MGLEGKGRGQWIRDTHEEAHEEEVEGERGGELRCFCLVGR